MIKKMTKKKVKPRPKPKPRPVYQVPVQRFPPVFDCRGVVLRGVSFFPLDGAGDEGEPLDW